MIARLLDKAGLTLEAAGALCGVHPRTIMNWRDGKTDPPAKAMALLEAAAADAELDAAPEMTRSERLAVLRGIRQQQEREIARMEIALADARQSLAETIEMIKILEKSQ